MSHTKKLQVRVVSATCVEGFDEALQETLWSIQGLVSFYSIDSVDVTLTVTPLGDSVSTIYTGVIKYTYLVMEE